MLDLLTGFMIFGSVCSNHPIMEEQCKQVAIKGFISHVECDMTKYRTLERFKQEYAKEGLILRFNDLECLGGGTNIDRTPRKVYSIL